MSLISIAKRVFDYDVHGFTIVNEDERYEEQDMVEHAVARARRAPHARSHSTPRDFLPKLRELVRHHDAPLYTITYFVHWLLMESIHEHGYRISISGTAADELFSGYYDHHLAYLHDGARRAGAARSLGRQLARAHRADRAQPVPPGPRLLRGGPGAAATTSTSTPTSSRGYLTAPFDEPFTEARPTADSLLRNRMLNELFAEAVPVILHEDDLNAMYFSIENRSPFLDRALYEFSLVDPDPSTWSARHGEGRAARRDARDRARPDPRQPPQGRLQRADPRRCSTRAIPRCASELLGDSPVWEHVRRDAIEQLLALDTLPNSKSKFLFNFVCAKLFLEEFER